MRTWILMASFMIAEAINPGHRYCMVLAIPVAVALAAGVIMDVVEFKKKL